MSYTKKLRTKRRAEERAKHARDKATEAKYGLHDGERMRVEGAKVKDRPTLKELARAYITACFDRDAFERQYKATIEGRLDALGDELHEVARGVENIQYR